MFIRLRASPNIETSKIEYAALRGMRDRVGTANRIELVKQGADVKFGRVDGNVESARYLFVRRPLGKQRENLELPRGQQDFPIKAHRSCGKHQGCISGFAWTN
jgi:hypothetical protein